MSLIRLVQSHYPQRESGSAAANSVLCWEGFVEKVDTRTVYTPNSSLHCELWCWMHCMCGHRWTLIVLLNIIL